MTDVKSIKIVADSSADILALDGIPFSSAPLKIKTAENEYVDDASLDVFGMVKDLKSYKGRSGTSCPNPEDWLAAFEDYQNVFCITITATLSGSYNSCMIAKAEYEAQHPDRRVFVLNSLSTGPEMYLIVEKFKSLVESGVDFTEACEKASEYSKSTGLLFMLESLKNLANNGRVSHIVAKMAGLLGIRLVGKASDKGDLEPIGKCRGEAKALECMIDSLKNEGFTKGRVKISHCFNEEAANRFKSMILKTFPEASVEIYNCRALVGFYAELGGMLVGFEKM